MSERVTWKDYVLGLALVVIIVLTAVLEGTIC